MKGMRIAAYAVGLAIALPASLTWPESPVGTAFTYQGQLKQAGVPLTASADFRFTLWDAATGGAQIGASVPVDNVDVVNGLFNIELDFGASALSGQERWLQIAVRSPAGGGFWTNLTPRQPVTPAPYAVYALGAGGGHWAASGNDIYSTNSGNVGIGVTNPTSPLSVMGDENANAIYSKGTLIAYKGLNEPGPGLRVSRMVAMTPFLLSTHTEIDGNKIDTYGMFGGTSLFLNTDSGGKVAIGTSSPGRKLQVGDNTVPDSEGMIRLASRSGTQGSNRVWDIGVPETDGDSSGIGYSFVIDDTQSGTDPEFMVKFGSGNVGIGTTSPEARLHVEGGDVVVGADGAGNLGIGTSVPGDRLHVVEWGSEGLAWFGQFGTGRGVTIIAPNMNNNNPALSVTSSGNAPALQVSGTAEVDVLQIVGADLAEKFPVSEEVEPGMVVAIDPEHPGKLCLARGEYNRRVAGVVSGANDLAPGAVLGHLPGKEDAPPVALSGRAWVHCDATHHAVEVGDLLTTSETPGHAMKVIEYDRARGAIIGKAMTALDGGRGMVLVLVSLQ